MTLVQSLSQAQLFATPWTAALQASLSNTNSQSLLKLMSIELVMPSKHLILCCPLLLLPSLFPSIGVFSSKSALCIRWPKYWSFSFSISPSNAYSGLISFRIEWFDLLAVQGTFKSLQKHQFFGTQLFLWSHSHIDTWLLEKPSVQFNCSVMSDSATPWTALLQASLSITNSWNLLKLMSIRSVMPSNHLILCRPLLLSSSLFPSIRVFSNESVLCIRWSKYWSFQLSHQFFQWIFRTDFP